MANAITRTSVVDPSALDPSACEAFIDELYAVQCVIFDGVSRDDFARYVVRSPAARTRIEVYRAGPDVVGYAAMHMFDCEVAGRRSTVVRCEVGLLREYRGQTRFARFFIRETLGLLLRAPGRPIFGLSCATSPGTYRTLARHAHEVWPHWSRETPPSLVALMDELAAKFHLHPVDADRPGVYHVGWQTRESEAEVLRWRTSPNLASRFYLERNPGYGEGHGLLVLVPMSPGDFVGSVARVVTHYLRRMVRRQLSATNASTDGHGICGSSTTSRRTTTTCSLAARG